MKKLAFAAGILSIALGFATCKKEVIEPDNPYDKVNYGTNNPPADTLNPTTITGLHRNVFMPKCAVPGCHDGNFEPDFRSVQSTYSTLVYADITKNNLNGDFKYRVVPNDTANSVLYERITNCCFVNQDDRMPQDNIGTGLPQADINNVKSWIMNGALSADGTTPVRPDLQPVLALYVAVNTSFTEEYTQVNNRVDSVIFNSWKLPSGTSSFYFAALFEDDNTPLSQMQVNTLKISTSMDDFSNAQSYVAGYINIPGQDPIWLVTVDASSFVPGQTYFMRYYVNDGQHAENVEFPLNSSIIQYKTYWSFIVTP
jgi:hypothetical protein